VLSVIIRVHIPQVHEGRHIWRDDLSGRGEDLTVPLMPILSFILQAPEEGSNNVTATFENPGHFPLLFGLIVLDALLRAHC
jgi:hypothetical protein